MKPTMGDLKMIRNPAKNTCREFFYKVWLKQCLSKEEITASNYLLLLGAEYRELEYLDELNVCRCQIRNVEKKFDIHNHLKFQNLGISLFYGSLKQYLQQLIFTRDKCQVLNLDIEGSYLNHLDPSMSSVLLLCWDTPQTVVATYDSVGRDVCTLREGLKSLVFFLSINSDLTVRFVRETISRYNQTGNSNPFCMALRDLFWLNSLLEHTIITSGYMQVARSDDINKFLNYKTSVWQKVVQKQPRDFDCLRREIKKLGLNAKSLLKEINIGLNIVGQQHVLYNSHAPWKQQGHFVKFSRLSRKVNPYQWYINSVDNYLSQPLIYINATGHVYECGNGSEHKSSTDINTRWYVQKTSDRKILKKIPPLTKIAIQEIRKSITQGRNNSRPCDFHKVSPQTGLCTRGILSKEGKNQVNKAIPLAIKACNKPTKLLKKQFPEVPSPILRSLVAAYKRKK